MAVVSEGRDTPKSSSWQVANAIGHDELNAEAEPAETRRFIEKVPVQFSRASPQKRKGESPFSSRAINSPSRINDLVRNSPSASTIAG